MYILDREYCMHYSTSSWLATYTSCMYCSYIDEQQLRCLHISSDGSSTILFCEIAQLCRHLNTIVESRLRVAINRVLASIRGLLMYKTLIRPCGRE